MSNPATGGWSIEIANGAFPTCNFKSPLQGEAKFTSTRLKLLKSLDNMSDIIPSSLIEQIESGNVVLFLGAGASYGASLPNSRKIPLGNALKDELSDKFLNGNFKDETLDFIAQLAISESTLSEVQNFISGLFNGITPANFHKLIPLFKWRALISTNYDLLVENTYNAVEDRLQNLVIFKSDGDKVDEKLRSSENLMYLKLHGCVTVTSSEDLPFILTTEQYATHQKNRKRLFNIFFERAAENTIIFVGYRLRDQNLFNIILNLSENLINRPRYYLIRPNILQQEKSYWESKRISSLEIGFEEFLLEINRRTNAKVRKISKILDIDHPIEKRFNSQGHLSKSLSKILNSDIQYLHAGLQVENGDPKEFYRGYSQNWYPIQMNLDVKRDLTDKFIYDEVLKNEESRNSAVELYVIKAEAGAGKSVFLRRLSWDSATQADVLCLYLQRKLHPEEIYETIKQIYNLCKERIFFFVDDARDNQNIVSYLLDKAHDLNIKLSIITTERVNEWNISCGEITPRVTGEYDLRKLNLNEIRTLVDLLTRHKALGPRLSQLSYEDQVNEFSIGAERQLLVALHEATTGKPFEEILADEFDSIYPETAKILYLTVCLLNRFKVPVRAGLIARVHNINFESFQKQLFFPLEDVVKIKQESDLDFCYYARHPEIAKIVFLHGLRDEVDKFNRYIQVINMLNLAYDSDLQSFRKLINSNSIAFAFEKKQHIYEIYDAAAENAGNMIAYVYQQRANYERKTSENFEDAIFYIQKALEIAPNDISILHTYTEILRKKAKVSTNKFEKYRFREEAKRLLSQILNSNNFSSYKYAQSTKIRILIDEFYDKLESDADYNEVSQDFISVDRLLTDLKIKYPNDPDIRKLDSDFARLAHDNERFLESLKASFTLNPDNQFITLKLVEIYNENHRQKESYEILIQALKNDASNHQLNFEIAQVLRIDQPGNTELISYYFRRAFSSYKRDPEAIFWYARYTFESTENEYRLESKKYFQELRSLNIPEKFTVRDIIKSDGIEKIFSGVITKISADYGFVRVDGNNQEIFVHSKEIKRDQWYLLKADSRINFLIGFSFMGAQCVSVKLTN
jgi:cold shock CspA family protein